MKNRMMAGFSKYLSLYIYIKSSRNNNVKVFTAINNLVLIYFHHSDTSLKVAMIKVLFWAAEAYSYNVI